MTTLFIVTSLSRNILDAIAVEQSKGDIIILTNNKDFYESYKIPFPEIMYIGTDANYDNRNDNKRFADQFMPGVLGDLKIPNSGLEAWKALSIDRLRFWYRGNAYKYKNLIENLDWNLCYTSLDMGNVLPMQAMWVAYSRNIMNKNVKSIAVKTEPIRTTEVLDSIPYFTFDGYIIDTEEEAQFLKRAGIKKDAKIISTNRKIVTHREPQLRNALRNSMGIGKSGRVLGVFLDKRDEWQASSFLNEVSRNQNYKSYVIVPIDSRSDELSYGIVPNSMRKFISPYSMLDACDEIVSFRWDDHYCFNLPARLKIIDYKGVNRAVELAPYPNIVLEA